MGLNNRVELAAKRTTGTGRFSAAGLASARRLFLRFEVEAVGATPTVTFTVQGSNDGVNWTDIQYVTPDSSVAASKAGVVITTVSATALFLDGLDKRFFDQYAVNVSANTNVTFNANVYFVPADGF